MADTIERPRPERLRTNATSISDERRAGVRERLSKGFSIEKSARVLFEGLHNDKLYIGSKAFQNQNPELVDLVRNRAENILNERNPEHPRRAYTLKTPDA